MRRTNSISLHARKPPHYSQIHSLTPKQPKMHANSISHLIPPCPSHLPAFKHPNAMNSALTLASFHSPSFNLKQRPPPQRQQISAERWKRQQCSPKPIRSIPGPNATGGPNNADRGGGNTLPSSPMTDVIQDFYSTLNDKDIAWLTELIDPDCTVKHTSYYEPLDNKNTITYFSRLMEAMTKNVKFAIDEVCQGVEPTVAAAMWHLGKISSSNITSEWPSHTLANVNGSESSR